MGREAGNNVGEPLDLSRIHNLVFDFDGTVGDSYAPVAESFNYAFRHFGLRELTAAEIRPWVGTGLEVIFEHYLGRERVEEASRLFREKYVTICNDETKLMPGVREALDALDGKYKMALCSNKLGDVLRTLSAYLDISRYFAAVIGASDVPNLKPHGDMLRLAMTKLGATAHDTLCIGDTVTDAEFGATCGVPCVLVLGGTGTREDLLAVKPVALLNDISELPALLGVTRKG
jgi:HAD superfamily hydrolase (TIGR01509 family)